MRSQLLVSDRLYAALLHLYPRKFRSIYGEQMRLTFRDACQAAYHHNGAGGLLSLWLPTLLDLLKSSLEERARQGEISMSKAKFIAWAGPLTVLVGVLWLVASFGELMILLVPANADTFWDGFWFLFVFLSFVPMLFALIGTRLLLHPSASFLGRFGLALSIAGCAGMIAFVLASIALGIIAPQIEQTIWPDFVTASCLLSLLAGYILLGVDALKYRLLPRWNLLPLLLGAAALFRIAPELFGVRNYHPIQLTSYFLHLSLTGACWILLGLVLIERRQEPQPAAAT